MNPASKHPKDPQLPSFPVWECVLRTQRTCQFNPRDAVNQTSQTTKPLILFPKSLFHLAAESHFFFGKPKVIDFPDGSLKSTTNSIAKRTNRVLRLHHICLSTLNIKQIKQLSTYIEVAWSGKQKITRIYRYTCITIVFLLLLMFVSESTFGTIQVRF